MRPPRDYWIYGRDDGSWEFVGRPILSFKREGFDWQLAPAMSAKNSGMNFSVEGATETHENFRAALAAIVQKHPELGRWVMSFDGPMVAVDAVLALPKFSWGSWMFYHGTAEAAVPW
jgi:hypothetical protein